MIDVHDGGRDDGSDDGDDYGGGTYDFHEKDDDPGGRQHI
jgi:hypothetical protein